MTGKLLDRTPDKNDSSHKNNEHDMSQAIDGCDGIGHGTVLGNGDGTDNGKKKNKYIDNRDFICVPFNMLSSERGKDKRTEGKDWLHPDVEKERQWIRDNILGQDNADIMKNADAMEKLRELGSDLNINGFALNWYYEDGTINKDLEEANYFMKRVVDRLSITSAGTDPSKIGMYLTSTKFEPDLYGECAQHFMKRLQLDPCKQDLFVLRNVVMSPFPTQQNFIDEIMQSFEKVVKDEVKNCRKRNNNGAHIAKFLIQGSDELFLVLQTSFHTATLRQQLIVAAELDEGLREYYNSLKDHPERTVLLESATEIDLHGKIDDPADSGFDVKMYTKKDPYVLLSFNYAIHTDLIEPTLSAQEELRS